MYDIQVEVLWVATDKNVADAPTRWATLEAWLAEHPYPEEPAEEVAGFIKEEARLHREDVRGSQDKILYKGGALGSPRGRCAIS